MTETLGTPLDYAVIFAYFILITGFGLWFGRYTKTTNDFFFGGQRFAWWLIAFSCVATTVGSYSFVKYSEAGFDFGVSSMQTYLNDWFWMPLVLCVWLPVIYYSRIRSVPEYFEKRFGTTARFAATVVILIYLIGYVGVNLYTIGTALDTLLGWPVMIGAAATAVIVTLYIFAGGQTSVIMTDLAQGMILLIAGLGVFFVGVYHLGGFGDFWSLIPQSHRYAFSELNRPDNFSFLGLFAQDGLANSGAFMLMNQGIIMRFLSMRSVSDARRMAVTWTLVLMPLAAVTTSGGGWVAVALMNNGELDTTAKDAFIDASHFLLMPGLFGFVLAALTAALMSTADTLVNATSSVFLNDVYRPYLRPNRDDKHYLAVARIASVVTVVVGLVLVLVFMRQQSVYKAHATFTAAVTPPIVVAILYGILWKRYTPAAALATVIGGGLAVFVSTIPPFDGILLKPFLFGMGEGSYGFMRALYGLTVCGVIGFVVTLVTKPKPLDEIVGLVTGTQLEAMRRYKGGEINRAPGKAAKGSVTIDAAVPLDEVRLSQAALDAMAARPGDLVYVCDARWWFGGLRSVRLRAGAPAADGTMRIAPAAAESAHLSAGDAIYAEKLI